MFFRNTHVAHKTLQKLYFTGSAVLQTIIRPTYRISEHQTLGTYPAGTLRFSFGPENTSEEIETAIHALDRITEL